VDQNAPFNPFFDHMQIRSVFLFGHFDFSPLLPNKGTRGAKTISK
jgi:hypothetical protein